MIGRNASRLAGAGGRPPGRPSRLSSASSSVAERFPGLPGNRYSRRVALLKVALPAIGVTLLLLVVAWPRLAPLFDRFRFAAIDLREARELRMMHPRYAGTDRDGRPVVVTAAVGRQVPQRDDVMALDQPEADLKSHSGANIVVTADSGVYQTQTQFLDLFGNVTVTHENGTRIITPSARLDAANNAAEGHDAVEGRGPSGDITAEGFQVIDKGDIVIFTGKSNLLLKGAKGDVAPANPAAAPAEVPAPVAQAAMQLEKAENRSEPAKPAKRAATPPHRAAAKTPAPRKPAAKKPG